MEFKYFLRVAVIYGFILLTKFVRTDEVVVQIPNGKIRGLILQTRQGRDVFTFYGIRYAEPPTGTNRFKPPIAAKKWNEIYNATVNGHTCMQNQPLSNYNISEDCLFLDVYSADMNASKPVILFIPGGSFMFGSKMSASFEYILDKEVVLVAINYRLDAFGYFSTGTKHASGNQGFKDQNLAMQWVRDNIKYFGGNPDLITLSGQSAGAMSVTLHMMSPMSYGLFHRAIAMSGSAVGHIESYTRNSSKTLLRKTNCNMDDVALAVGCLQKVPAKKILEVSNNLINELLLPWYYEIENENDEQSPFIVEHPVDTARKGHIQDIPLMTGTTHDEIFFKAYQLMKQKPFFEFYLRHLHQKLFPKAMLYRDNPNRNEISEKLYSFYIKNQPANSQFDHQLGKMISDGFINTGVHRMMEYTRPITNVYYYRLDYQGRYSQYHYDNGKPLGILHQDDLQYILVFKQITSFISVDDPENPTIERMTSWWSKFAETGDPNDPFNNWTNAVYWTPCTKSVVKIVYVNETYKVSAEPYQDRYDLWDSLFPIY